MCRRAGPRGSRNQQDGFCRPSCNSVADASVKLQYDLYYLKHQSLYLDLYIAWKTVGVIVGFKGT